MQKIKLATVYERLNKDRLIRLLKYILKVQGAELKRLDFPKAEKELKYKNRAALSRDVQALERSNLIIITNGELCLVPDILEEKKGA